MLTGQVEVLKIRELAQQLRDLLRARDAGAVPEVLVACGSQRSLPQRYAYRRDGAPSWSPVMPWPARRGRRARCGRSLGCERVRVKKEEKKTNSL